jgi:hypothetical protein
VNLGNGLIRDFLAVSALRIKELWRMPENGWTWKVTRVLCGSPRRPSPGNAVMHSRAANDPRSPRLAIARPATAKKNARQGNPAGALFST